MANKRRPQGDGTIRKRADGRWEGRIIIGHKNDGAPMYKSVFGKTQKSTLTQMHKLIDLYRDVEYHRQWCFSAICFDDVEDEWGGVCVVVALVVLLG